MKKKASQPKPITQELSPVITAGRTAQLSPLWFLSSLGYAYLSPAKHRAPRELLDECLSTIADLERNHPELRPLPSVPVHNWKGCYRDKWDGWLPSEAYQHPAKFARGLIVRILDHGIEQGYWKRGQVIGDPFGGVATGGIVASRKGFQWIGGELEAKFVTIGEKVIGYHQRYYCQANPRPFLFQGDSRQFDAGIASITGDTSQSSYGSPPEPPIALDGALLSPPYDTIHAGAGGLNHKPAKKAGQQSGRQGKCNTIDSQYGTAEGQIARAAKGTVDGAITSPPFEDVVANSKRRVKNIHLAKRGNGASDAAVEAQAERDRTKTYGTSAGQIGVMKKQTYWEAVRDVYAATFRALKPGGYAAIVVKDHVKKKKRVPLCDDTLRLLLFVGFEPVERIHALLDEEDDQDVFSMDVECRTGATTKAATPLARKVRTRKSFYRRIYEAKGGIRIDWECVLVVRKPLPVAQPGGCARRPGDLAYIGMEPVPPVTFDSRDRRA